MKIPLNTIRQKISDAKMNPDDILMFVSENDAESFKNESSK